MDLNRVTNIQPEFDRAANATFISTLKSLQRRARFSTMNGYNALEVAITALETDPNQLALENANLREELNFLKSKGFEVKKCRECRTRKFVAKKKDDQFCSTKCRNNFNK